MSKSTGLPYLYVGVDGHPHPPQGSPEDRDQGVTVAVGSATPAASNRHPTANERHVLVRLAKGVV